MLVFSYIPSIPQIILILRYLVSFLQQMAFLFILFILDSIDKLTSGSVYRVPALLMLIFN